MALSAGEYLQRRAGVQPPSAADGPRPGDTEKPATRPPGDELPLHGHELAALLQQFEQRLESETPATEEYAAFAAAVEAARTRADARLLLQHPLQSLTLSVLAETAYPTPALPHLLSGSGLPRVVIPALPSSVAELVNNRETYFDSGAVQQTRQLAVHETEFVDRLRSYLGHDMASRVQVARGEHRDRRDKTHTREHVMANTAGALAFVREIATGEVPLSDRSLLLASAGLFGGAMVNSDPLHGQACDAFDAVAGLLGGMPCADFVATNFRERVGMVLKDDAYGAGEFLAKHSWRTWVDTSGARTALSLGYAAPRPARTAVPQRAIAVSSRPPRTAAALERVRTAFAPEPHEMLRNGAPKNTRVGRG